MRCDVFMTPGEAAQTDIADRTVVVIDLLRATTTMVQALSEGARAIYPVGSIEEALRLANTFGRDEVLLCGERKCVPIEGFDLGNSPREFTADKVAGKTLVMSTTNGTAATSSANTAERVLIASLLNMQAVVADLVRTEAEPVVLCAGRERQFALEDALAAGELVARLTRERAGDWRLNDGAMAALTLVGELGIGEDVLRTTAASRGILEAGLDEDIAFCVRQDVHDLVPVYKDRMVTLGPAREGERPKAPK